MMNPVRTSAGWLAGRLGLFLLILAALVVIDASSRQPRLFTDPLDRLLPDRQYVERLEAGREDLGRFAAAQLDLANDRLRAAGALTDAGLDARIEALDRDIAAAESSRRTAVEKTLALLNGSDFTADFRNEIDIRLLAAERDALVRLRDSAATARLNARAADEAVQRTRRATLDAWDAYRAKRDEYRAYVADNPAASRLPFTNESRRAGQLLEDANRLAREYNAAGEAFFGARDRQAAAQALQAAEIQLLTPVHEGALEALDQLIATRRIALETAQQQARQLQESVRRTFLQALGILVAVTLAPIGIKAFWFWWIAPLIERRPPIRLLAGGAPVDPPLPAALVPDATSRRKVSAVSQEVTLGDGDELLVHPDYLQSAAYKGRKDTRWLLDWRLPFTSVAAGMVALTRIRNAGGETFVVSSKNDPFAEVGALPLAASESLVLQPRNLVGIVQPVDRPIRIVRRWRFGWSAWITFQFRYLIFQGPGTLLVQGCRGVRLEPSGSGRSIDQTATMGFSAALDYRPRRTETFGAYLLGVNGLFNDSFAGGPGYCVYEEMPYAGRRAGLTGRGFEGLTDAALKVFGI
jgi:uncharacterized protein (AIM24 family)